MPITRLQAIREIRLGRELKKTYRPETDGVSGELEVIIQYTKYCDFQRAKQWAHQEVGPIHVRFWSGSNPHWIHITPKQLLGWIKRTYSRHS
jgi:hypothetical protein